jgi:hypothetical protein
MDFIQIQLEFLVKLSAKALTGNDIFYCLHAKFLFKIFCDRFQLTFFFIKLLSTYARM